MSGPFEIYADEFSQILGSSPELTLLSSDLVFAEGVCWLPSRNYVIVSDFPNNRIMKWDETSGMDIFRQPSDCANGNTVDAEGRVLSCLTRGRTVVRLEHDGTLAPVADSYMGGKLTSPNDVVVKIRRFDMVYRPGLRLPAPRIRARRQTRAGPQPRVSSRR